MVLGILVLEDLSMAVYLPILTALLAGVGLAGGSMTLLISLGTVSVVLFVALRYGRVISRAVSSDNPEMLLLVVLGLTLLVAGHRAAVAGVGGGRRVPGRDRAVG